MEIQVTSLEKIDEQEIHQIRLKNDKGVEVAFLTLGATWQEFLVPTSDGEKKNVIIGFDKPSEYGRNPLCAGQSIGRVAGRIDGGEFEIDERRYQVVQNEKGNCLHGGPQGFHTQIWSYHLEETRDLVAVVMSYRAKESIDGFPGDVTVEVRYSLDNSNRVAISYTGFDATEPTLFNPTNHVYVNLSKSADLSSHMLTVAAAQYLETREDLVPTGKILEVGESVYNFQQGENLAQVIQKTGGLDDAFIVEPSLVTPIAKLTEIETGEQLLLYSDRSGLVIYTMGDIPKGIFPARDKGIEAQEFESVALEAQFLPDAIHHTDFGDIIIRPGEVKTYHIIFEYQQLTAN